MSLYNDMSFYNDIFGKMRKMIAFFSDLMYYVSKY